MSSPHVSMPRSVLNRANCMNCNGSEAGRTTLRRGWPPSVRPARAAHQRCGPSPGRKSKKGKGEGDELRISSSSRTSAMTAPLEWFRDDEREVRLSGSAASEPDRTSLAGGGVAGGAEGAGADCDGGGW